MYNIAICEDDKNYITYLRKIILATALVDENELSFFEYYSGKEMFLHPELYYDLVIMDIRLDDVDGYEIAMKLRQIDNNFLLVFCSGIVRPTTYSFKAAPFRYLLKDDEELNMIDEMKEIIQEMKFRKSGPFIMCKGLYGREQIQVHAQSILYIGIGRGSSKIYIYGKLRKLYDTNVLKLDMRLDAVYEIFNEKFGFTRPHNSYIINMSYVVSVKQNVIKLIDGTQLTIARSKEKEFHQNFTKYISLKYKG